MEDALKVLQQRIVELQYLATEAERGRERAIAEACLLQQQREFFHESTKEALNLVATISENSKQPAAASGRPLLPELSTPDTS